MTIVSDIRSWMFLSCALLAFSSLSVAQASQWKTYSYPEDGFSISFPSDPSIQTKSLPAPNASSELKIYMADAGTGWLLVAISKLGETANEIDPNDLLQEGKIGGLENSQTHLVWERKITLGDHPGLEFEAENASIHVRARLYLVGTTLYQVAASYPADVPFGDADRMLESFALVKNSGE